VLCAGSTLPLAKQSLDEAPYKLFGAGAKLAGITFSRLAFSYWIDYLGFITEGKTYCYIHQTLLLGFSNWPVIYYTQSSFLTSSSPRHQEASVNFWMFGFCFIQFREYFPCNFSETQKQQKTGNWYCGISLIG
jgi:hypothetical protein